ncbi:MAG: cob(I)yrinic acid a,c-diamide adenosyltransferase [Parasporobacterium sp.]|nr:cob(I)yrinic acid a,c-diamide adenosyltransferase [Parasporobacterium sp.]
MTENKSESGLIHIYTGEGKGKTTAGLGLCLRAAGCDLKVLIARFLKNNDSAELKAFARFPNVEIVPNETTFGFSRSWKDDPERKQQAKEYYSAMLETAIKKAVSGYYDILLLDEILASVRLEVVERDVLISFLKTKPENLEVIMTGRDPLPELIDLADYVSEIKKIKHPFDQGIIARRGIEY